MNKPLDIEHEINLPQGVESLDLDLWRKKLQLNNNGKPLPNSYNVAHSLEFAPELSCIASYNSFAQKIMLVKPAPWSKDGFSTRAWCDFDDIELLSWLQANDIQVRGVHTVSDAVKMVANRHNIDPLMDYLEGLEWDGVRRLSCWLNTYTGVECSALTKAISRAFLISAVARGLEPGCQVDHVLCLEGPQAAGKSTVVRILGGEWTQEHLPDMHSKDGMASLAGCWFVELSELAAMTRSEVETVKSYITRCIDRYRPAYGRHTVECPRRCVFIATTNERTYLRDTTGNRRFWPVQCGEIDTEGLMVDRNQLFAEAVHAYKQGEQWHFTDSQIVAAVTTEQAKRVEHDPWMAEIADYVLTCDEVTTSELLKMLDITMGRSSGPHAKRVAGIMRQLGFNDHVSQADGKRQVFWTSPRAELSKVSRGSHLSLTHAQVKR